MSLGEQTIDVPLGGGVQTKADPKLVPPGSLLVLENSEFDEAGAASKRNGYDALSKNKFAGGAIDNARAVFAHGDELIAVTKNDLLSWAPSQSEWVSKAGASFPVWQCSTKESRLPARSATGHQCDVAIANGIAVFAYRVTQPAGTFTTYATVVDITTGVELLSAVDTLLAGTSQMRVIASGNIVYICSADHAGNIHMTYVDTSNVPSTLPAITAIVTASGGNFSFDLGSLGGGSAVIGYTDTANDLSALIFTTSSIGSPVTVIAGITVSSQIGIVVTAASEIFFALKNSANNLTVRATNSTLAAPLFATVTIDAALATSDHPVGIETSTNVVTWLWNAQAAGTGSSNYRRIRHASINNAGTVTVVASDMIRNHHLLTRPWLHDSTLFVGVFYAGAVAGAAETLQPTSFVWRIPIGLIGTGAVVAKLMAFNSVNEASLGANLNLRPSSVASPSSSVYWFGGGGSYGGLMSPARLEIDFTARPTAAKLNENMLLSGGMPLEYDGSAVFEQNFNAYPEIVSAVGGAASGSMSDGVYQVAVVFVHVDGNGNVHRSAPSAIEEVTLSAGGAAQRILIYVPSLFSTRRDVRVEAYCSAAGGTTLHLSATAAVANSVETTVIVTAPNTSARILYTTGGILPNSSPPALVSIASKSSRVYGVTHSGTIWYTKKVIEGEGAAYVQETTVARLPKQERYALTVLGDALVAVGEVSFFALTGEGLDDTGAVNTLSEPVPIDTDDAAIPGSPVLATDAGVWFKSKRGLCLLGLSRAVEYVGAPVEDYNGLTLVSAVLVPNKGQIRFGHSDGATLAYDYNAGQWSVFTNHTQVHATYWDGKYVLAQSDGDVWAQSTGFTDGDAADITRVIETPWIKVTGIQGFKRLWYMSLLGEYRSAHTCTVTPYFDYSQTPGTARSLASSGLSSGDPLQFRMHLGVKCQAVKFRITESNLSGTREGFTLAGVSLECGGKGGLFRQRASKTV